MTASATDAGDAVRPARPVRLLSGVDTVCELLVARRALDEREGLDTATFVSGYPGSPLGGGLAALRRVRGTPLDVFGYARHRREERQVAGEYAELMARAISRLTPDTYDAVVDLARSVGAIRGCEDIKSASIERWRADTAGLRAVTTGGG